MLRRRTLPHGDERRRSMRSPVRRMHIYLFLAVTALFWFAMYTYVPIFSTIRRTHLGGSLSMAGLVVGAYGVTQMVIRIPLGFTSDRLGRRKPFVIIGLCLTVMEQLRLRAGAETGHRSSTSRVSRFRCWDLGSFYRIVYQLLPRNETARTWG